VEPLPVPAADREVTVDPTPLDQLDRDGADEKLLSSLPPDKFTLARSWTLDSSQELSALRSALLRAMADEADEPAEELGEIAENMVLIASELATNALKYGIPPTVVRLLRDDGTFLLDVVDHDLSTTPYMAGERPAGHGGLGMHIAQQLAQDIGWYATGDAKHVWAVLDLHSAD